MWGDRAYIKFSRAGLSAEERSAAAEQAWQLRQSGRPLPPLTPESPAAPEWTEYRRELNAYRITWNRLSGRSLRYRYSVGFVAGPGFHVQGGGDSWAEAIAQAEQAL